MATCNLFDWASNTEDKESANYNNESDEGTSVVAWRADSLGGYNGAIQFFDYNAPGATEFWFDYSLNHSGSGYEGNNDIEETSTGHGIAPATPPTSIVLTARRKPHATLGARTLGVWPPIFLQGQTPRTFIRGSGAVGSEVLYQTPLDGPFNGTVPYRLYFRDDNGNTEMQFYENGTHMSSLVNTNIPWSTFGTFFQWFTNYNGASQSRLENFSFDSNVTCSGTISVSGTVTKDGLPVQAELYLIEANSQELRATTLSNASTGFYKFEDATLTFMAPGEQFFVMCDYQDVDVRPLAHGPLFPSIQP